MEVCITLLPLNLCRTLFVSSFILIFLAEHDYGKYKTKVSYLCCCIFFPVWVCWMSISGITIQGLTSTNMFVGGIQLHVHNSKIDQIRQHENGPQIRHLYFIMRVCYKTHTRDAKM